MNNNKNLFEKYLNRNKERMQSQLKKTTGEYASPYVFEDQVYVGTQEQMYEAVQDDSNDSDPLPSGADLWRLANVQGHSVNLSKKQEELFSTEATWLPQAQQAKQYVDAALALYDLNKQDISNFSDSQLEAHNTQKNNLLQQINEIEPKLKEFAKYNPYIRNIFFETNWGNAINEGALSFVDSMTSLTRDWRGDFVSDINPANNLEHAISTRKGGGGSLSDESLNNLFRLKTDINSYSKLSKQQSLLNDAIADAQLNYDKKQNDIVDKINTINKGNFLFDPTKIDPTVKKEFEESELSLKNPKSWLYALPHIGSSYSEVGATVANITASATMNYLAKGALTAAAATATGGSLPLLYAATELGVNYAIQNYSRDAETKSEMFDNYQQVVTKALQGNNIQITEELSKAYSQLKEMGYPVEEMTEEQRFGAMIANRIQFSDPQLNKTVEDARKGLNVLSQTNSGLQLLDMVEAGLYSYGGKYLKQAYKLNRSGARQITPTVANAYEGTAESIISNAKKVVTDKLVKAVTLGSENAIKQIAARRIIEGVGGFVGKMTLQSQLEKQEEGIQYLVGQEYQQGKYNDVENYSFLDGVANDIKLGYEARLAYYGLHPDDALNSDTELKKNMDIGGFTGLFMGSVYSTPEAIRGLQQLVTDKKLQELAANGYSNAEDDAKIEAFLNASTQRFKKSSYERIANTLERLRETKPDEVSEDMIKSDLELLNNVYTVDNLDTTAQNRKDLKIDRKSDTYTKYVKNTLHLQNRLNDALGYSNESTAEVNRLTNTIVNEFESDKESAFKDALDVVASNIPLKENQTTEQVKQVLLGQAIQLLKQNALNTLKSELAARTGNLKQLATDRSLDVNTEGIEGVSEYVDELLKEKVTIDPRAQVILDAIPNKDQITSAYIASVFNNAVAKNLRDHLHAYTKGMYIGYMEGIKPTWNNITDAQKNDIRKYETDLAREAGKPVPTESEIIAKHNEEVENQWKIDDEKADKIGVAHKRALAIIQRDLNRREQLEQTVRQEIHTDRGDVIDEITGEDVSQPDTAEQQIIQTETSEEKIVEAVTPQESTPIESPLPVVPPTPKMDSMEEEFDAQQAAIDQLAAQTGQSTSGDLSYTDDSEGEVFVPDNEPKETKEEIARQLQDGVETTEEGTVEQVAVESINNLTESGEEVPLPVTEEEQEDLVQQQNIADTVKQVEQQEVPVEPTEETIDSAIEDSKSVVSEQPAEEPKKPETTPVQVNEPNVIDPVSIDEVIADPNQIFVQDDAIYMSPTGNQDDVISIDPNAVAAELFFEDVYNQGLTRSSSEMQNHPGYASRVRGIDSLEKQKRNLIGNTFFFQPTATEPLVLKANNKEVEFTTKDGKKAIRGTGSQLAENLAIPGWLATADDVYYIVTDKWMASRRQDIRSNPIADLAVHMIIEKDGVVYTASLRTVSRAQQELKELGVSDDNTQKDLDNLMRLRTRIIEAYCNNYQNDPTLPSKPRKDVKPVNLRISNGQINNQKENNLPKYRKLTEVYDLQITSDPYALTDALESGEIEIGYGKGAFAMTDPFSIQRLDGSGQTSTQAYGYAGKLYIVPKPHQVPSQQFTPPIMLSEELHDIPGLNSPDSKKEDGSNVLELVFDAKHQQVRADVAPTTAEMIYELLTTQIYQDQEVQDWLLTLLANHGPKTTTNFESRQDLDYYVRKNLSTYVNSKGETMLVVGMARNNQRTGKDGKHVVKHFNVNTITEGTRRQVIFNIAKNIHWNTDKDFMMTRIPNSIVTFVVNAANQMLNDGEFTENTEVHLLGNDVVFTLADVGYKLENGKIVKSRDEAQAPSVLAWMINHGKIKTDVGDRLFYAPFVYADDVTVQEPIQAQVQQASEKKQTTTTVTEKPVTKKIEQPKQDLSKQVGKKPIKATPENLAKYGLILPDEKAPNGFVYAIGFNKETGIASVVATPKGRAKALGLFSTTRGRGKMNEEKAKAWLNEKLGIDPTDVITTKAVLRTHSDEEAYGVLRVAFDRILNEFKPTVTLRETAGRGIEYHEAWHYVSMLLLSEQERQSIYQDYVNRHNKLKNMSNDEVEELLAEEFRDYMNGIKHKIWNYRIQKMFAKIANMFGMNFLSPSLHMQMFAMIDKGVFAKNKPSQKVLREFSKAYKDGLYYYIPGLEKEDYDKVPHISDANTFYNTVQSLSFASLQALNIRTKEDLQRGLDLGVLFKQLEDNLNNGFLDEIYEPIAVDVLLNRPLFEKYIKQYLQDLDVDQYIADQRANEKDDEQRLQTETGEINDNVWDQNQGDHSKKDNASKNAKLFFFSIPDTKWVIVKNEETGELTREVEEVTDPIFGLSQPVPFSIAWNKVLENLWDIDNLDQMISRCATLGQTDSFFLQIHQRLTDKDNPLPEQVLTQLENTIKSSKNAMNTIEIRQDVPQIYEGMSDIQIQEEREAAKKRSIWEVLDSDDLRKIQRYPKNWSLAFFASDNVIVNSDGTRSINHDAWQYIQIKVKGIDAALEQSLKKGVDKLEQYCKAKQLFIELCNQMSIPFDSAAFDYMINSIQSINKKGESMSNLSKFRAFWNNNKTGSFRSIIANIESHVVSKSKTGLRQLDKMFTTFHKDAHINLMAAAYGKTHPSPEEFSVTGADGALIYPISENNYMSDQVRWLNQDLHGKRQNILNTAYGRSSLLAANAGDIKLRTLIAMQDQASDISRDYFGISPIEDYIAKLVLTENDEMTLPTMSDKKTWYSISGIPLLHEFLPRLQTVSKIDPITGIPRSVNLLTKRQFSKRAIEIFSNYFLSELDSVIEYYQNKDFVGKNREYWRKNYYGKIKDGKIQPGGNGGRFRYFSTISYDNKTIHLNKDIDKLERNHSDNDVMQYLRELKSNIWLHPDKINQIMTNYLSDAVDREINYMINLGIISRNKAGQIRNELIPHNIINKYNTIFKSIKTSDNYSSVDKNIDILYSIVASHVLNTQISIQEVEKCFVGDPAFYKWATVQMIYKPNDETFEEIPGDLDDYLKTHKDAKRSDFATYDMIVGRDVDKIKRLSSVLSTGTDLRTYWGEGEEHAEDNDTSYTVLNLKDNEVYIPYYDTLKSIFRSSLIRETYSKYHPDISDDELFKKVTSENEDEVMKEFTEAERNFIEKQSKLSAKAYYYDPSKKEGINQADAAVYMRPAMWRKVMRALGKWNDEIEEAYNIMESNDAWMDNPSLYKKATSLILNVQKMVYMGDTYESKLGLDIPVFNKMAIFPLFKTIAKADNRHLYNRMNNEELGVIDMLVFESSVKVGLGNAIRIYKDGYNNDLNLEELNKPSFTKYAQKGNLPTLKQDIKNLRLQLNTDPHEHTDRAMGTQAVKMFLSNILDDRMYGQNKGLELKGETLKTTIMDCINELTYRGYTELRNRFFTKSESGWHLDNKKLSEELIREAKTSGMSQEVIYGLGLDEDGEFRMPISALSSRGWIESRIISIVNKLCVDINTKGGAAIQMPDFGFKKTSVVELGDMEMSGFGDGKPLSFLKDNGSMEVMLTTNFFRHIVPIEHQSSFGAMRKWLLDNEIIGPKAKPLGLGYRIPTQGSSSTFSFTVKDVLPKTMADTIVVPDGFTAMTGSDFDIDKLYIATFDFKDGKKVEWDDSKPLAQQSKAALINRMLEYQQVCISDDKNMAETRASIDTLTSFLKKDVLNAVQPKQLKQALPGYELLPSFQLGRKVEYTSGKAGIAPFALNSTNHALTQFAHLNMYYSKGNKYNLGSLDAIYGEDGFRILDWLSAMINAHVDVAKDPYIIALNVNQITYNITNLLLRGGKGQTTFYFLAQDILKLYSQEQIANRGVYGVDPTVTEGKVLNRLYSQYENNLYKTISAMPESEEKEQFKKLYNGWARTRPANKKRKIFGDTLTDFNSIAPDTTQALNIDKLKNALKVPNNKRINNAEFLYQQLLVLKAYSELNQDAKRLAKLVKRSQIDTKKFGNNLALQMNFRNSVNTFFEEEKDGFYLTNQDAPEGTNEGTFALQHYFNKTFLNKKLHYATSMPRKILKNQSFVATVTYENLYNNIMRTFSGETTEDLSTYKDTSDKDFVTEMNRAIESVVRARVASNLEIFNKSNEELYNMITGPNSMCYRLTKVRQYLLENADKFPFMVDKETATITNALLNYMNEYPADNDKRKIDRIILFNSSMNNDIQTEERLISAFDDLLNSEDEYVRQFAEDLAVYGYLTSYDNPGVNNFFNFVPLSWKIKVGYTDQMKQALKEFANLYGHGGQMVAEKSDNPSIDNYPSIALTIARNLWRNNEIVPVYDFDLTNGDQVLLYGGTPKTPSVISAKRTDKRFIKIGVGEDAKLYRKVGTTIVKDLTTEKTLIWTERNIYVLTPKLGVNDNGTKIYEFINSSTKESIFPSNALNNDQIIDLPTLLETINLQKDQLIKKQTNDYSKDSEGKYELMFKQTDDTIIESMVLEDNQEVFMDPTFTEYTPFDNSIVDYTGITEDPTMVDTSTLTVEETPVSFESEASIFNDMGAMLEQMVTQIEETPLMGDVQNDIFTQAEIASNLGEQIKKQCKGD